MAFVPGERWVEDTDEFEVLVVTGDEEVRVVLVERVESACDDLVSDAVLGLDRTATADAVARLQVVAVLQRGPGSCLDNGVSDGEAENVVRGQKAFTGAVSPVDGIDLGAGASEQSGFLSLRVLRQLATTVAPTLRF